MNIFFLDRNTRLAAEYHVDKHVVKMILESAQLLSTAHRVLDGTETLGTSQTGRKVKRWILPDARENVLYSATHINHPSAVWVRQNIDHYRYQFDLYSCLMDEYTYRYGKDHKCRELFGALFDAPHNIDVEAPWSDPPQAMPDDVKVAGDSIQAYRNYYAKYKNTMAKWTKRQIPYWWS